jgi:hypothetical protein
VAAYRVTLQKTKDAEAIQDDLKTQEKRAQAMVEAGEISRSELAALPLQLSASALGRMDALTKSLQAFQQLEDAKPAWRHQSVRRQRRNGNRRRGTDWLDTVFVSCSRQLPRLGAPGQLLARD